MKVEVYKAVVRDKLSLGIVAESQVFRGVLAYTEANMAKEEFDSFMDPWQYESEIVDLSEKV